jgi:hypothetical protein
MMKTSKFSFRFNVILRSLLIATVSLPAVVLAQTDMAPSSVERLHQTTLGILEALVAKGILSKSDVDAIVSNAAEKAKVITPPVMDSAIASTPSPAITGPGVRPSVEAPAVRVPFVPEVVKRELREEIRKEVIAQAKAEGWVSPTALPEWVNSIRVSGDVRTRLQSDRLSTNAAAAQYFDGTEDVTNFAGLRNVENQNRLRLRARLAIEADVNEKVRSGIRISTGNQTSPVSTSSTSGDSANRFGLKIDRAYIQYSPLDSVRLDFGRFGNPFHSADLMFAPELGLDGLAATYKPKLAKDVAAYATVGVFPLRNDPFAGNRKLIGTQIGADWAVSERMNLQFALAKYNFDGAAGVPNADSTDAAYNASEYEAGYRQRGNTLFRINQDPFGSAAPVYGLASRFNVQSIFAALEFKHFDPTRLILSGETIVNKGFNEQDVEQRVGLPGIGKRNRGYTIRVTAGTPTITKQGQWQLGFGIRKLERDATLDALTDPDFVLGGTNVKGNFLTYSYGIEKNTSLGFRFLAGETIDPPLSDASITPLKVRTLQLDMNVRF